MKAESQNITTLVSVTEYNWCYLVKTSNCIIISECESHPRARFLTPPKTKYVCSSYILRSQGNGRIVVR